VPSLSIDEKDYGQSALLGHVITDAAHRGTAYERFTAEGPAALLPYGGPREYSMVWVSPPARIEELKALDDAEFMAAFQQHFGSRAGKFLSVSNRRSFPLKLRTLSSRVAGRIAIIGNAAQVLHPVAGQGFNLGLRDADDLSCRLSALSGPADTVKILQEYAAARDSDVGRSVGFTDFLVGAFSNDHLLSRVPRGIGLAVIDMLPFARRALARRMLFGARK
jgi:2-octaprenyl-6-methoxyphenol hydroxylase